MQHRVSLNSPRFLPPFFHFCEIIIVPSLSVFFLLHVLVLIMDHFVSRAAFAAAVGHIVRETGAISRVPFGRK